MVAAQLLAHWVTGGVSMQSIHPGYLLPVVPGFFVASIGFSSIHAHNAAIAAFGIGAFFWLVIGTIVSVRLMTGGELSPAATTGLSAYLAAPATANIAWMLSHPEAVGSSTWSNRRAGDHGADAAHAPPRVPQASLHANVLGVHLSRCCNRELFHPLACNNRPPRQGNLRLDDS
ncbi:hypothetical protein AB0N24_20410 [Arthrobacter sp. NPDC093128]|uniref:SLAC1 family transporter n=1 Tax=Arthrobacter sp. NPDC093128 TaxID=3154979 RepID=UPI003442FF4D